MRLCMPCVCFVRNCGTCATPARWHRPRSGAVLASEATHHVVKEEEPVADQVKQETGEAILAAAAAVAEEEATPNAAEEEATLAVAAADDESMLAATAQDEPATTAAQDEPAPMEDEAQTTYEAAAQDPSVQHAEVDAPTSVRSNGVDASRGLTEPPPEEHTRPAKRARLSPDFVPGETCGSSEQVLVRECMPNVDPHTCPPQVAVHNDVTYVAQAAVGVGPLAPLC